MIGRRIQNYKVLSLLGEGGMGIVYKVFDAQLERYAALKILHINSTHNSSFVERFKREARNQAKLSHPNIVSVYGFVQEKDVLGIAMEYIEGDTVESIIKNSGKIEFGYAVELMEQILNGVESAHNQGFIHRDLKPSNIILDLNGNPKIMDFGISKSIDELKTITQHNARPGTLLYMSPEQLSGNTITIKSDLYALGITFYEMLSGFHPYNASTIYEIIDSHVNKTPEAISSKIQSVPPIADEIILRAMNKSPINNFNTTSDFINALSGLTNSSTIFQAQSLTNSSSYSETTTANYKKQSKGFQRITNILLFILFIGLGVIVFNVVKSIIMEENENQESQLLNYTQDYSKNPNYLNASDWELLKQETNVNLNSIAFTDDYKGYIVGDSGLVMQSSDGGISWKKIDTKYNNNFNSIFAADNRLFIIGSSGFIGYLNSSTNEVDKINSNTSESLFRIYFINSVTGLIVGSNGLILKTDDGGVTWRRIQSKFKENLFSLSFADPKNGIIVGWNGTILKTIDQGLSWHKQQVKYKSYLKDVLFVNEFLGFIVGGEGRILRTENGGNDWDEVLIDYEAGLYKISFDNNSEGIILSNRGDVFFS
ncbi:MAG: protein kinase, partial [Ignavibacteria bacterium]|nr:protein kinase [Ignavibacteria bacterium]